MPKGVQLFLVSVVHAAAIGLLMLTTSSSMWDGTGVRAQTRVGFEYRVLATSKTSTMEKEMNEAAEAGFRFRSVMGGETAVGGSEVVAVMVRALERKGRYAYKLLA